MFSRLLGH